MKNEFKPGDLVKFTGSVSYASGAKCIWEPSSVWYATNEFGFYVKVLSGSIGLVLKSHGRNHPAFNFLNKPTLAYDVLVGKDIVVASKESLKLIK